MVCDVSSVAGMKLKTLSEGGTFSADYVNTFEHRGLVEHLASWQQSPGFLFHL